MRLLVLGGTSWLGGAVAEEAVAHGWDVTCLARGESGAVPAGATLMAADRWQPRAYDGLPEFDAAVEVSWQPELVRTALASVRATHWVYVSSISAYADGSSANELLPAWAGTGLASREVYGEAKVACEEAYLAALPVERTLIARVGLIGGYGDRSDRLGYWPARIASAVGARREVLVPEPTSGAVQVIDVLDLAQWLVLGAQTRVSGVFDVVGREASLQDVLDASVRAAGADPLFVPAAAEQLLAAGVRPWMGPESLPLWVPSDGAELSRDNSAAQAAGLVLRPLEATVSAALRWERELGLDRERTSGLSAEREIAILGSL
ncbi:MAG TPA: oxidoreductase [Nocardioidaceae bacterium]|nr:oxidoreductase [Nocardioidaceae bacterium]